MSRRSFLGRALQVGTLPAVASLAAACGSSGASHASTSKSDTSLKGTIVFNNYPDWLGPHEIPTFEKQHSGAKVKLVTNATSSSAEVVLAFKSGEYDLLLGDTSDCGQAAAAGFIDMVDAAKVPNLANVSEKFRKGYPWGIPTDYGKVGIGYRPDIVGEKITSWHDVWRLAPKLSGQVVFIDLERDCMGSTLKYLGYSSNTTNSSELKACQKALTGIKPHLKAFLNTNVGQGLVDGSTAIAMDWDYDVAVNKQKQPKIEWVNPSEGMHAYLEGFTVAKKTSHLDLCYAFMNFLLEPKEYAQFVNFTGTAYVMPKATPSIKTSIANSPILVPSRRVLDKVEFDHYLGAAGTTLWANVWQEVKAA